MLKHQNTIDTSFIISIPMLFNIFLILCNVHTLCFSQYCCCLVVAEIMACARDPNSRDRDRDVQPRDRTMNCVLLLLLLFFFLYPRYLESRGLKAYTKNSWND